MDKGFNDDELADIMNEIENLEQEFTEESLSGKSDNDAVPEASNVEDSSDQADEDFAEMSKLEDESDEPVMEVQADIDEGPSPTEHISEPEARDDEDQVSAMTEDDFDVDGEIEVLNELSKMPVEEVTGQTSEVYEESNVTPIRTVAKSSDEFQEKSSNVSGAKSQMSFSVEGDMKLDLSFNISGKMVHLNISEHGFEIELDGGMKFSIPVTEKEHNKKAA